jgi:hypothetical protein
MTAHSIRQIDHFYTFWAIKDYLDGKLDMDVSVRIIEGTRMRGLELAMLVYGLSGHHNQDAYQRVNSALQQIGMY